MPSPAIFISYRIADTLTQAGRLNDSLAKAFGKETVFYDKNQLEGGDKWPDKLSETVRKASVTLVLVGSPKWLGINEFGVRRIDDSEDWVRKEVEAALNDSNKLLIPILFNDAKLPPKEALPDTLKNLHNFQARIIREAHWEDDLQPLINLLREHLQVGANNIAPAPGANPPGQAQDFHAYSCDRDEQYERFDALRAAIQPASIHFFYLYGEELHAHKSFFRRIEHELAGRYARPNAPSRKVAAVELLIESEGVGSPERLRERFVRNLYTVLGADPDRHHPLLQQNLQNLLNSSPKASALGAGDYLLVYAHINHWFWNAALTPDAARWFAATFCPPKLPDDSPAVIFFFAFDFDEETNPGVRKEVLQVVQNEAEYVKALPELQMVRKPHVAQWMVRHQQYISVPLRQQLLDKDFAQPEHYMENLQIKLEKLINDHFNQKV
jgi:hypothetical protein